MNSKDLSLDNLIEIEAKRLSKKFNKEFLDCSDIIKITGLGRDNVRTMMKSKDFPIIKVGKRQVVSITAFALWYLTKQTKGDFYG